MTHLLMATGSAEVNTFIAKEEREKVSDSPVREVGVRADKGADPDKDAAQGQKTYAPESNVRKADVLKYRNRFAYLSDQRFNEVQQMVSRLTCAAFWGPGVGRSNVTTSATTFLSTVSILIACFKNLPAK